MPPLPSTMAGPALTGKLTQPTKPPPIDHTTPLPLNGVHQSNNKQQFNTHFALLELMPNLVQVATQKPVQKP